MNETAAAWLLNPAEVTEPTVQVKLELGRRLRAGATLGRAGRAAREPPSPRQRRARGRRAFWELQPPPARTRVTVRRRGRRPDPVSSGSSGGGGCLGSPGHPLRCAPGRGGCCRVVGEPLLLPALRAGGASAPRREGERGVAGLRRRGQVRPPRGTGSGSPGAGGDGAPCGGGCSGCDAGFFSQVCLSGLLPAQFAEGGLCRLCPGAGSVCVSRDQHTAPQFGHIM